MDVFYLILWFAVVNFGCVVSEISLKFVFIIETQDIDLTRQIANAIRATEKTRPDVKISEEIIELNRENEEESFRKLCSSLNSVSAVLELTWHSWSRLQELSEQTGLPVIRSLLGHQQAVMALHQYLEYRNATDVAMLLDNEYEVDQTLYHLLGSTNVRIWVHAGFTKDTARALKSMRPEPSFHAVIGDAAFVGNTYQRAVKEKLVRRDYRWTLILTDYSEPTLDMNYVLPTMVVTLDAEECCRLMKKEGCSCPADFKRPQYILTALLNYITESYEKISNNIDKTSSSINCETIEFSNDFNKTRDVLFRVFSDDSDGNNDTVFYFDEDKSALYLRTRFILTSYSPQEGLQTVTAWRGNDQFTLLSNTTLQPLKQFFRIGVAPAVPWTIPKLDATSGEPLYDDEGKPVYEGYCIDLIEKLAEAMNLEYELVTPKVGTFGQRLPNGSWDGVVGDLMTGETDFAVAALTMTAEREEVIDFVAPYFEQTGILIVIRKPIRKTSLFKFMTVLRTEVWFSIVGALVLTGGMIWFLDKYSPYSARNNKEAYPYPCREFTLKESFWFALTSFTPQGGGEAPKALSGRTLVAAYWLFVVLMLATFTANLAAFLTVERMQTPVSSLEQLARQSRINYTVVEGSPTHQYFMNMKFAEDTLYRVWKEITLNATSDQAQYRVWDYPIKEQYGHILLAINASVYVTGPVRDANAGFREVNNHADADFAFIHDSAEIKYEITRNCNLTEVGEIFAEQPYAIAVQQGSRLQEDLSRVLLDLQKERFLEQLSTKYWNETARRSCPDADESEGITLESLGGVFIATLFGLGLAMITLAWEVFYYKRKEKNQIQSLDAHIEKPAPFAIDKKKGENKMAALKFRKKNGGKKKEVLNKTVTIGDSFKPVLDKNKISYINVYPKDRYQN